MSWRRVYLGLPILAAACSSEPGGDATTTSTETSAESSTDDESGSSTSESGTEDTGTDTDPSDTSDTDPTDTSDTGELPAGCGMPSPGSGTHTGLSVMVDGMTRDYELFVPVTYDAQNPSALVLNFHGLLGAPSQQADFSEFNQSAQLRGMIVAYPEGVGASFNAGACCGEAEAQDVDDVAFARALVDELVASFCIDPDRVYATGMSNGGHMSHTLACEAADVFAAVGPVAGVMGLDPADCQPARPISIVDFHGTADLIVQYGGLGPGYPPVHPMMEDWAARNGCSPVSEVSFDQDEVLCETWPGCDDDVEVTLCTIDGGGHCWPGNDSCLFGNSTTTLHASEVIADMFSMHTLD